MAITPVYSLKTYNSLNFVMGHFILQQLNVFRITCLCPTIFFFSQCLALMSQNGPEQKVECPSIVLLVWCLIPLSN